MNFKIFTTVLLAMALGFAGCKKFLQVNPKDSVSEKQLFSSEVGFDQSLTGIFSVRSLQSHASQTSLNARSSP